MPFVTIKIVAGQPPEAKERIAQATARAIHEVTGISLDGIWIVFEDQAAQDWYVGTQSVALQACKTAAQ